MDFLLSSLHNLKKYRGSDTQTGRGVSDVTLHGLPNTFTDSYNIQNHDELHSDDILGDRELDPTRRLSAFPSLSTSTRTSERMPVRQGEGYPVNHGSTWEKEGGSERPVRRRKLDSVSPRDIERLMNEMRMAG